MKRTICSNLVLAITAGLFTLCCLQACSTFPGDTLDEIDVRRGGPPDSPPAHGLNGTRPVHTVSEGESIQETIHRAGNGGTVHVRPGLYVESVSIPYDNFTLKGLSGPHGKKAVLQNPGSAMHGIFAEDVKNISISNIVAREFGRNGIFLMRVDGFVVRHVTAEDNGMYGIYPVRSSNGAIIHCTASGHADAGLYIGQSSNVRILNNETFANVIGIEISNSSDVEARGNDVYNNSAGILAALLPPASFRTVMEASRFHITQNNVWDNNLPNFAPPGLAAAVPAGSGILALGLTDGIIEKNTVTGHNFVGIALGSGATLAALLGVDPVALYSPHDPHSYRTRVQKNQATGNGASPPPIGLPGVDLLWDMTGSDNCWDKNTYDTIFPHPLQACGTGI